MSKRFIASVGAPLTIVAGAAFSQRVSPRFRCATINSGPYNVTILEGGEGLTRKLAPGTASLEANGSMVDERLGECEARAERRRGAAGVGSSQQDGRALMLDDGELVAVGRRTRRSPADTAVEPGAWTAVAATYDGKTRACCT